MTGLIWVYTRCGQRSFWLVVERSNTSGCDPDCDVIRAGDPGLQGMYDHLANRFVEAANTRGLSYSELPAELYQLNDYWLTKVKESHVSYLGQLW